MSKAKLLYDYNNLPANATLRQRALAAANYINGIELPDSVNIVSWIHGAAIACFIKKQEDEISETIREALKSIAEKGYF